MHTWIKLAETVFNLLTMVNNIEDTVPVMAKDGTGTVKMPHVCTIITEDFFLLPEETQAVIREALELENPLSPVFVVPKPWRMPQVMKALGVFKSTGEASRNGWNKDIEFGISVHSCKMNHAKRWFTTFRPSAQ